MKTVTMGILVLASVVWTGCASRGASGTPLATSSASCLTPHEKVRQCRDVSIAGSSRTVCDIDVLHQGNGKTNVYPFHQNIPSGQVTIVWEVRGQGKEFRLGDGPLELKTHAACSNGSPSSDKDGATPASSGKYYRLDCDGTKVGAGIYYTIQFTDKNNATQSCDPNIVNENG